MGRSAAESVEVPLVNASQIPVLVLAASRRGSADPVARLARVSHKCLVPINGVPMIALVIGVLRTTPGIGRIFVSIDDTTVLRQDPSLREMLEQDNITVVKSRTTLADSVAAAVDAIRPTIGGDEAPYPLLITTGDNALHTPEMIRAFCVSSLKAGSDVTVGMTAAETVLARYPTALRAFHRFKDGAYSGCNIYMLCTPAAGCAARVFAGGGQFGKKPRRLIAAFGIGTFILHLLRRLTLQDAMHRIGKGLSLHVSAVMMPFAEGPIDVDAPADHALAEEILRQRKPCVSD